MLDNAFHLDDHYSYKNSLNILIIIQQRYATSFSDKMCIVYGATCVGVKKIILDEPRFDSYSPAQITESFVQDLAFESILSQSLYSVACRHTARQ
jgi:hypothetical protein